MTTRRELVRGIAAAGGLLCLPAIARRSGAEPTAGDAAANEPAAAELVPLRAGEILPTPDFGQLRRSAQFVARVRPHRRGGVRLALEGEIASPKGPKFLIHNYGHSGAGITLSFGCAGVAADHVATAVNQMRGTRTRPAVAILGCGVVGLTTAAEVRRKWPRMPISIYAKTLDVTATTSFAAGGQFAPSQIGPEYATDEQKRVLADYLERSAARIREIENSGKQLQYGIVWRKNYTLPSGDPSFDKYTPRDIVPAFTPGRLPFQRLNVAGREYSTWLLNPRILLPKLMADLARAGVQRKAMEFQDRQQVENLDENIVVNCTGYGAKSLFEDDALVPHRGHLAILNNPARLKYFFSGGCTNGVIAYLFARQTDIVVGGTVRLDDRDRFDDGDPRDAAACNLLLDNIANVFDGNVGGCTAPAMVA